MSEKAPNTNKEESVSNYWKKLPRKIAGVLGVATIAMNPMTEILTQETNSNTRTEYYSEADFKYQKEQIMSQATGNLLLYASITERIQKHLETLKNTSSKEYRLFQKELEKGKEYSIVTNKNTVPYEVVHVLVGKEGKILGTMVQQNEGQTMRSFIDVDGDGIIDRTIVDTDPIADIREKTQSAHRFIARDVQDIAEQFTDHKQKVYFPHNLVITDFSLSESASEIVSVDYNRSDRPAGTKRSGDGTFIKILEQSGYLNIGLTHAQNHLEEFIKEDLIAGPLVSR
jgi:hypothetical protein